MATKSCPEPVASGFMFWELKEPKFPDDRGRVFYSVTGGGVLEKNSPIFLVLDKGTQAQRESNLSRQSTFEKGFLTIQTKGASTKRWGRGHIVFILSQGGDCLSPSWWELDLINWHNWIIQNWSEREGCDRVKSQECLASRTWANRQRWKSFSSRERLTENTSPQWASHL